MNTGTHFPLVRMGGSAGGLGACTRPPRHPPPDMDVATVIVNHLRIVSTPLHEILPRHTKMPVDLITEGMMAGPNRVFIIPPRRDSHVTNGEFPPRLYPGRAAGPA